MIVKTIHFIQDMIQVQETAEIYLRIGKREYFRQRTLTHQEFVRFKI